MSELYRKMWVSQWCEEAFRDLSDGGKLLVLRFIVGPESNAIPGIVIANKGQLGDALGWTARKLTNAFAELSDAGLAQADWKAGVVVLPGLLGREKPKTPNVIKSWGYHYSQIPGCELKRDSGASLARLVAQMSVAFQAAFRSSFPKALSESNFPEEPFAIQTQTQNQIQKQEQEQTASSDSPPTDSGILDDLLPACQRREVQRFEASWQSPPKPLPADWYPSEESRALAKKLGLSREELDKFVEHVRSHAKLSADWDAEFRLWLRRAAEWARERRTVIPAPKVRSYAEAMREGV